MKIRFAQPEDKEQVIKLLDELLEVANKKTGVSKEHKGDEKRFELYENASKRDDIKIFVVEEKGKLIGVAELYIVPVMRRGAFRGVIESFVVTKSMRGKGIGSALIKEIISYCKKNGFSKIHLTSALQLIDAHRFYERHGAKFTEKMFRFDLE